MSDITPETDLLLRYAMFRKLLPRLKTQIHATADHVLAKSGVNEPFDPAVRAAMIETVTERLVHFLARQRPPETISAGELEDQDYLMLWFEIDDPARSFKR